MSCPCSINLAQPYLFFRPNPTPSHTLQSLESPGEFLLSDFSKMERPALLHLAFQALDAYQVGVQGARQTGSHVARVSMLLIC